MKIYKTNYPILPGSEFKEVHKHALSYYKRIKARTKRRPYVRSVYFRKSKVFLNLFWTHLFDKKNWKDRVRRLKYFPAAMNLIRNTRFDPISKNNPNKNNEILHRFYGKTSDNVKENKRNS